MWWSRGVGRAAWGVGTLLLLSACGFQLRGEPSVTLRPLSITQVTPAQTFADIRRALEQTRAPIVTGEFAAMNLRVLGESREKTVATITGTGRVYEFQLRLAVRYEVVVPGREIPLVPPTEIVTQRLITYSEAAPTAKEAEEQILFKDMQVELAGRIVRQLAVAQRDL